MPRRDRHELEQDRADLPAVLAGSLCSCHDISVCVPMCGPEGCGSSCCHLRSAR